MGIPREILSDQGSNFMSQLLKEIYRLLHIHPTRTTPYHPQTDGLVERFNKTLKSMLKRVASEEGRNWVTLLLYILFAYREALQAAIVRWIIKMMWTHVTKVPNLYYPLNATHYPIF